MSKLNVLLLALALPVLVLAALQAQQQRTRGSLTALDYAEIQQLYGRYAIGYDSGNGEMFARAFTADGRFNLPNDVIAGREKLAEFAGRPGGNKGPTNVLHVVSNVTIEPSAEGATGTAYVLLVNIGGSGKPSALTGGGIYRDTFVKSADGWRIKSRTYLPAHSVAAKSSAD
jgi:hypothetical protein